MPWINNLKLMPKLLLTFGVLLLVMLLRPRGLVPAGATLVDRAQRWAATVGADGSIRCGRAAGSIHQVGAAVQEAPSCNGWTFWHVRSRDGRGWVELTRGLQTHESMLTELADPER